MEHSSVCSGSRLTFPEGIRNIPLHIGLVKGFDLVQEVKMEQVLFFLNNWPSTRGSDLKEMVKTQVSIMPSLSLLRIPRPKRKVLEPLTSPS